jgi:hypothetical protein
MIAPTLLRMTCAVILFLIWPAAASAQPGITGATQESRGPEGVLLISGTQFGTHANYNPGGPGSFLNTAWQDFEAGELEGGNLRLDDIATYQWSVRSSTPRPNSRFYARKVYIDNRLGELNLTQAATTGQWFVSFWFRVQSVARQQSGKFFRIWGDRANAYLSTGGGDLGIRGFSECESCAPAPATVWASPDTLIARQWHRVDIQIAQTPDRFAVYLDGKLQWRRSSLLAGDERQQWIPTGFGADGHTLGIGGMLDSDGEGWPARGSYQFDDVFIDYTWSRVELGDAPTWEACTHREVQLPREWSDTRIVAHLNPGAFSDGQTVYAYVVDASGAVNPVGEPVVLSGKRTGPKDGKLNGSVR